ncbi:MAG: thiamine biosynthesis protein ThiF [Gammaproteobacteria bacterium]
MNQPSQIAETLNRTVKIALDTGEAATVDEAEKIFAGYRMQIIAGPDIAHSAVMQAGLLTAVNCAARCLLGGVTVVGAMGPLRVPVPGFGDLAQAVAALGGVHSGSAVPQSPTLVFGDVSGHGLDHLSVRATFNEWCGGAVPVASGIRLDEQGTFTPAGVLAGAIGVAEIFQRLRGGCPLACRRAAGLDLWRPEHDWLRGEQAAPLTLLPATAWIVGLGNLGQAYLWTLGLLPYGEKMPDLVLQDFDVLAQSNLSTSLLTFPPLIGRRKSRALAEWADRRGFGTTIIERRFADDFRVGPLEPQVALIGVDNPLARRSVEDVGFGRIVEAGLGAGPKDYLGIDVHTFPAERPARDVWRDADKAEVNMSRPAYQALLQASGDPCGTLQLAGRSIGAPFVGAVAAALVVAELVRLAIGAPRYELVSCHLRDLDGRTIITGQPWLPFNPGSVPAAG